MKDADRHRCDKYREVQSERADQKQHDEHSFQVGSVPDIAKAVGQVSRRSESPILLMKFTYAKQAQRAEQGGKRDRADREYHPEPVRATSTPATAGPTMRAVLNEAELRATLGHE